MFKRKGERQRFITTKNIAYLAVYIALMIIFNFTPQLGYINIGITSFTTMIIPVSLMSIHFGWKGALIGWTTFGILYFAQVFISFAGVLPFIGVGGAFVVYFVGRLLTGILMASVLKLLNIIELSKERLVGSKTWWLLCKVLIVAILGSVINGFLFMAFWYAMDPLKSDATMIIFLTNFGIAFGIEIPMTAVVLAACSPLIKWLIEKENSNIVNTY